MHPLLIAFIVILVLKVLFEVSLDILNRKHVAALAGRVPEAFEEFIEQETYDRSIEYTLAKNRFSKVESVYDGLILFLIILVGFLPWLYGLLLQAFGGGIWAQALILYLIGIVLSLPGLPLEWWSQFRLEERFGFNKSTIKLWISDKLKGLIIGFLIGYPILCLLLWMMNLPFWWLWAFVVIFFFQIILMIIYPMFIMPLFNKFEPLPEGTLRNQLMQLSDCTGFKTQTILVMDGSKRSGHSNAFFTGFGKFRRIVLFDTLIEQLKPIEVEAVLAHEIGHYKLGHIPKRLAISAISTLVAFRILAWLSNRESFFEAFGFSHADGMAPALLLFALLSGLVTFWLTPILSSWARKHEYEADAFSRDAMKNPDPLIRSLRILHERNLSNLSPHPLYSRFYYSHPTLLERENALRADSSPREVSETEE